MVAPTLLDYAQSTWTGVSTGSEVTADLDWAASGDLVLCLGATEDNTRTLNTPTATGLTFAAMTGLPTNTGSSCKVYGWKATAAGNNNSVVTATGDGSSAARGISAWAFSGSDGIENPVVNVGTGLTVSVAVQQADSTVCMVLADWNATTDVAVTTTPAGGTVRQINNVPGVATFAVVEWTGQAAGTRAYGLTAWTGTGTVSKAAVEVRGSAGSSPGAVTLTPAEAAFSAVAVSPVPVPGAVTLVPAVAAFSAVAAAAVPGAVTVVLTPASIAGQAVSLSPVPGAVTVPLTPALLTSAATPIAAVPQPVTVALVPAVASFTVPAVAPVPGAVTVALTAASATLSAVPVGVGSTGAVALTPAVAALSARPLTATPGAVTVLLAPAVLSPEARPLTATPGAVTVALAPAVLTASGVPFAFGVFEQPGSITSDSREVTSLSSVDGSAVAGGLTSDVQLQGGIE